MGAAEKQRQCLHSRWLQQGRCSGAAPPRVVAGSGGCSWAAPPLQVAGNGGCRGVELPFQVAAMGGQQWGSSSPCSGWEQGLPLGGAAIPDG